MTTEPDGTPAGPGGGVRAQAIHHDLQRLFKRLETAISLYDAENAVGLYGGK